MPRRDFVNDVESVCGDRCLNRSDTLTLSDDCVSASVRNVMERRGEEMKSADSSVAEANPGTLNETDS